MLNRLLPLIILFFTFVVFLWSCSNIENRDSKEFFHGLWTIEVLYLNNTDIVDALSINTVYLSEDGSCSLPIEPFKDKKWNFESSSGSFSTLTFNLINTKLVSEEIDNCLIGTFNTKFYTSEEFFYMELSNDSVMVLLQRSHSIILSKDKIPVETLRFEEFIPFPDFYSEYYITGDYHFNWFKDENYPRIDSNFKALKSNYDILKPFLNDLALIGSSTKIKSCFKEGNLLVEDVSVLIIDLLENYEIKELENMNRDSCIYSKETFELIKEKIKGNLNSD